MSTKSHVPDKLFAYTAQIRQMMFELISLNSCKKVSIEQLDDVATHSASITVQQVKSVQSNNNPISDFNPIFWKTLYNWLSYIKNGSLDIDNTKFQFVIISIRAITIGSIQEKFFSCKDQDSALIAYDFAINKIQNEYKDSFPETLKKFITTFLDSQNKTVFLKIIENLEFIIYQDDFDKQLYKKFSTQTIPPEYSDELFIHMLGWVNEKVNESIKYGDSAVISCAEFHNTLVNVIRRYDQNTMIKKTSPKPLENDSKNEIHRRDVYIQQLELINSDATLIYDAASDFLQTSSQKTDWARKGLVHPDSFHEYNDSIKIKWNTQYRLNQLLGIEDEKKLGMTLYLKLKMDATNELLQGKTIPIFFGNGTLQSLANSKEIGWHPQYKKLIK